VGASNLRCDRCQATLPAEALNTPGLVACPRCNVPLRFLVFPAYTRAHAPGQAAEKIMIDGESSCYNHPEKKATVACEGCGRFLCALCDIEFDNKHLCLKCLAAAKSKGTMDKLEIERYRYDLLARNLGLASLLIFCMPYFAIFIAGAAIFVAIRYWRKPVGLLTKGKSGLVAGVITGMLGIALSGLMLFAMFGSFWRDF